MKNFNTLISHPVCKLIRFSFRQGDVIPYKSLLHVVQVLRSNQINDNNLRCALVLKHTNNLYMLLSTNSQTALNRIEIKINTLLSQFENFALETNNLTVVEASDKAAKANQAYSCQLRVFKIRENAITDIKYYYETYKTTYRRYLAHIFLNESRRCISYDFIDESNKKLFIFTKRENGAPEACDMKGWKPTLLEEQILTKYFNDYTIFANEKLFAHIESKLFTIDAANISGYGM